MDTDQMKTLVRKALSTGDTTDPELNDLADKPPAELTGALGPDLYQQLIDLFESDPDIMGDDTSTGLKPDSNPSWIEHLGQLAADMTDEDVRLRVITSNGRPMFMQLDLYRGGKRVATAGRDHRIGFASGGVNDQWTSKVQAAIETVAAKV